MNRRGFTLMEILVVIGIVAILLGLGAPPLMSWYRKGKAEDYASNLQEAIKWIQIQAIKRGEVEVNNDPAKCTDATRADGTGALIKQKYYIALNPDTNAYMLVQWRDDNCNNIKESAEFAVLPRGAGSFGGETKFGFTGTLTKTACDNASLTAAATNPMPNFTALSCPGAISLFSGYRCASMNGKGNVSSMQYAAAYITNGLDNYAVSLNPAGIATMCRWDSATGGWKFIR